jgi:hypothetical protein
MSERTQVEMGTVADADVMVHLLKASEAFFNAGLACLSPERQQYINAQHGIGDKIEITCEVPSARVPATLILPDEP